MVRRRLQLRRLGKALLTGVLVVNLMCVGTLYSLYSTAGDPQGDAQPQAPPWKWKQNDAEPPWGQRHAGFGRVDEQRVINMNRGLEDEGVMGKQPTFDSPCKELSVPLSQQQVTELKTSPDTWKTVVANGTYVYSAFYDNRTAVTTSVVILGMSSGDAPKKWCQLWYPQRLLLVPAHYDIVPETHDAKYAPSFHTCPLYAAASTQSPPDAVSLVVDRCDVSSTYLHPHVGFNHPDPNADLPPPAPQEDQSAFQRHHGKHKPRGKNQPFDFEALPLYESILAQHFKYNYTVCVTPLNYKYKDVNQLVEMIEVNRMFGADHFVFYDYDSGPAVKPYLQYYINKGIVDVLSWKVPVKVSIWPPKIGHIAEIHYFAQLVALNDCVYRSMHDSKYAVLTDLDEIIVPQVDNSWDTLLAQSVHTTDVGAWMFQNCFFRMDWENVKNVNPLAEKYGLRTILKTKRELEIHEPYSRSKVIVRPQFITMSGIHFAYRLLPGKRTVEVDPSDGMLHHYRKGFNRPTEYDVKVDSDVLNRFESSIISRVKQTHDAVNSQSNSSKKNKENNRRHDIKRNVDQ